jgi:hypothetical protein
MKVTQKKIEAIDKIFCIRNDRFKLTLGNDQSGNGIDKGEISNKLGKGLQRLLSLIKQDLLNLIKESPEKLKELLEAFLDEIPSSILYSQQVQKSLHTILGTISKYCLLPGANFVVADTVKRVREHVPLSKRGYQGFVGLSQDRRNGTPSETIENNLRPLKLPKPLAKGERRAKNDPDYYERWANRENNDETPFEFLERVWGDYIRAGLLYQTDLRGTYSKKESAQQALDKRLFDVVSDECRRLGKNLPDILPTKSDEVENRFRFIESKASEFPTNRSKVRQYSFTYRSKRKAS